MQWPTQWIKYRPIHNYFPVIWLAVLWHGIKRDLHVCDLLLTVSRLEDESVFTQYLFHSISRSFLSNDDLKYETSKE